MAFTTLDQVVAALPGQQRSFSKASIAAKAAGSYADLFQAAGVPSAGAAPAAYGSGGTAYTNGESVAGAIPWTVPGALAEYLGRINAQGSVQGTLILYDRLWACSGMSGTVTTAQTIASFPGLPSRASGGAFVEPWLEWYTATGATAVSATLVYTDNDGNASQSSAATAIVASPLAAQMIPISLAAGDTGVRVPTSVTLSATTGTAGSFGVTLLKRIAEIPVTLPSVATPLDVFSLGLPVIPNNACLCFMFLSSSTTTGVIGGTMNLIEA